MPARRDIKSIMIIGAGPIVIGQACEFDYSGTQSCRALMKEGYRTILVNSNPATIMTDPDIASRTYIESLDAKTLTRIIEKERPDALLPTMGGQTALNVATELGESGVLDKYSVELIGATLDVIRRGEDRDLFRKTMQQIGIETPRSRVAHTFEEAFEILAEVGLPAILRPSFTLGGAGGGIATNRQKFAEMVTAALRASGKSSVLIEESIIGWKEYELEVVRDSADNAIIVCSIENIDPMGIHTGDSVTVAPAMTLTDKEYQKMRDSSIAILRAIGVDTGGANVQFAVDPKTGRQLVIEMNPRVSRSSALASKATGFPIARVAAKLAVGYTLDELQNDITKTTPASFEPSIDYVVCKIPRFDFEKFDTKNNKASDSLGASILGTTMQSVGEAMAIGHSFCESLQKALRSLESGFNGLSSILPENATREDIIGALGARQPNKLLVVAEALRRGFQQQEISQISSIDPWFVEQIADIIKVEQDLKATGLPENLHTWSTVKSMGFADERLAQLCGKKTKEVTAARIKAGCLPIFRRIDSTAAEIASVTAYMYSTFRGSDERSDNKASDKDSDERSDNKNKDSEERNDRSDNKASDKASASALPVSCESRPSANKKIAIIGSGPNRIGQGIEFDYACVHAALALREAGFETIMINCNPETVSTDYDISDRLYFEPLDEESVVNILLREMARGELLGVIVQLGGQTPLKLAQAIKDAGIPVLGTSPESIAAAEDRDQFQKLMEREGINYPQGFAAVDAKQALKIAQQLSFPLMVRPSFVIGGRSMEVINDTKQLDAYLKNLKVGYPLLLDRFLLNATEYDVDALTDGAQVHIAGILEHIEQAGIHSGDSACITPALALSPKHREMIEDITNKLAKSLKVVGLMNIQFATCDGKLYVLEVNPRASRTIPFISKARKVPYAKMAALVMAGKPLAELNLKPVDDFYAVKEAVFPFNRFTGVDVVLGPEMRSTGEVMGIDTNPAIATWKAQLAAGNILPSIDKCRGKVYFSIDDADKPAFLQLAKQVQKMGLGIAATRGTADYFAKEGVKVETVNKNYEGGRTIIDHIIDSDVALLFNTGLGETSVQDGILMRREALIRSIPYCTTHSGAKAALDAMAALKAQKYLTSVNALQD